jgi:hypothetical protein
MILRAATIRPLPVVLPPVRDELLSSWLHRHAAFYGVSRGAMLRHCLADLSSPRELDLSLDRASQKRLGDLFRCDPLVIRGMTHLPRAIGTRPTGLIATTRPMQVCKRCAVRHQAREHTRDARLRSWMVGWRLSCPVCGASLEDARPLDVLARVDAADPFLAGVAGHAREGEDIMTRALHRSGRLPEPLVELMRVLLLPSSEAARGRHPEVGIPRLLDVALPGFDRFMQRHYPTFLRPGTLLLAMSIRIPVLVGLAAVMRHPAGWIDPLLAAAHESAHGRLAACFEGLATMTEQGAEARRTRVTRRATEFSSIAASSRTSEPLAKTAVALQRDRLIVHVVALCDL